MTTPYLLNPTLRAMIAVGIFTCLAALVVVNGVILTKLTDDLATAKQTTAENQDFGRHHMVNYQSEARALALYQRDALAALCDAQGGVCPDPPNEIGGVKQFRPSERPQEGSE